MSEKSVYLRSINIVFDAERPERIAHFQPTAKSVTLIQSLLGLDTERAFFVTAPYGSGKSLAATYATHLVQNQGQAKSVLSQIQKRFAAVSPAVARFSKRRLADSKRCGIVLVMEGFQEDVGVAFQQAAISALRRIKMGRQARSIAKLTPIGAEGAVEVLNVLCEKAAKSNCDRILIQWDEFGRHLERLVSDGKSASIGDIQKIAEFAARRDDVPVTFVAIMHRGLLSYAGSMSQSGLAIWRKVEGRFKSIQFVDDSKELYQLVAKLISSGREDSDLQKSRSVDGKAFKDLGLFNEFTRGELNELLEQAAPLDPIVLYLLPRLAARAAQNERTLFGFVCSCDKSRAVTASDLFDYFEPAMRADTGVGGTYRAWLETESAVQKAKSGLEVAALKTVGLLGLGLTGERAKVTPELLIAALESDAGKTAVRKSISSLTRRKLLLKRKHAGEIALWHGTDVDLRGRLAEEQAKIAESFDLEAFLEREFPAPIWRPTEYNDQFKLRRFFSSRYVSAGRLRQCLDELAIDTGRIGMDGEILYILCDKQEDVAVALERLTETDAEHRCVFAVPQTSVKLREAAAEVACLEEMQLDDSLLERDPLVANELAQMLDDSRAYLSKLVSHSVMPSGENLYWSYRGQQIQVRSATELRRKLSSILREVFSKTPRLNNEMIVRRRPSPNIVNSRKKLVLGILERYGQDRLGLVGEFADASMFRTILFSTGLYRSDSAGHWRFAQPNELTDENLREIWSRFKGLLTEPDQRPKDLVRFFRELQEPPYGVRFGVIPIFFAAALKAFPSTRTIVRANGEYVGDLLPSQVEEICKSPENFYLTVLPIGLKEKSYLGAIRDIFAEAPLDKTETIDLVRECFDAIENWTHSAPPGALTTRLVSKDAQRLQMVLSRKLAPTDLLFSALPRLVGSAKLDRVAEAIAELQAELARVNSLYRARVARVVRRVFSTGAVVGDENTREVAADWAECFPEIFVDQLDDPKCRALLKQLQRDYIDDSTFIDMLVTMVADKSPARWDDNVILEFERNLHDMVAIIENQVLEQSELDSSSVVGLRLGKLLERRIAALVDKLAKMTGSSTVEAALGEQLARIAQLRDEENGDTARSA